MDKDSKAGMTLYMGFDDTDVKDWPVGTGRLARQFCEELEGGCVLKAVVRHQLPREDGIPFTSNNSSACLILEIPDARWVRRLTDRAADYLVRHSAPGSDPGLCVCSAETVDRDLVNYALQATSDKCTQKQAMAAANGTAYLVGLGGTNDGLIGAAAAVGLTRYGWCGRFIEYGSLRSLKDPLCVGDLLDAGIRVLSVDRDPTVPQPSDAIEQASWLRPSLWSGQPVLQVLKAGDGCWKTAHTKRKKAA